MKAAEIKLLDFLKKAPQFGKGVKGGQACKFGILSKDLSLKGFQTILAVPGLIRFLDG